MLEGIRNSKNKTLLAFCFCFLFGVFGASLLLRGPAELSVSVIFFLSAVAGFGIVFWSIEEVRFLFLCCLCLLFGIARYSAGFPSPSADVSLFETRITIEGIVADESDVRTDGIRYIVRAVDGFNGKIYLKQPRYPQFHYGDRLTVSCLLQKPEPIEEFRYDMYLATKGVFALCSSPQVLADERGGVSVFGLLYRGKEIIADHIFRLWQEPHASFVAGILYGYRGGLGKINDAFSKTGVTHIIAISGYNISVVSALFLQLCFYFCIPKKKAFWYITIGITVFVIFTGASASVVRAGVMGVLILVGSRMGRRSQIGTVLVATATVMTLANPFVLVWDAGFQLSFLSTVGLVYLSPFLEDQVKSLPPFFGIKESFVTTSSAILATLPLILFQFGRLSLVALPTNLLILWIVPFLMIGTFAAVVVSFFFYPLGILLADIVWFGLEYVLRVVSWFASLPFASVDLLIPWWGMVVVYSLGILVLVSKTKKDS